MTAFDFPNSPVYGETYQYYMWDGEKWVLLLGGAALPPPVTYANWDAATSSNVTLSGSNLIATATAVGGVRAASGYASGKYYWEQTGTVWTNNNTSHGIALATATLSNVATTSINAAMVFRDGTIYINGVSQGVGVVLGLRTSGDIIGIAVDIGAKLIWFRVCPSGNWNNGGANNPATGVGGLSFSALSGAVYPLAAFNVINDKTTANFGASAFSGSVPSGFTSGWTV